MNEYSQCGAAEPFALRVIGNDMAPEFCDGNIVVVDPGGRVKHGCFVIAELADDTVLLMANITYIQHLRNRPGKKLRRKISWVSLAREQEGVDNNAKDTIDNYQCVFSPTGEFFNPCSTASTAASTLE